MADKIQFRRDTAERWKNINPTLAEGEIGLEVDTQHQKIGDGVNAWNDLEYTIGIGNITSDTGDSENLVINQKSVTELIKGTKDGMAASDYIAIRVPDFAIGVTTADTVQRQKEIFNKFVEWLNAVDFAPGSLFMGHCILGLDGRNIDVYNYINSYDVQYGIQVIKGALNIDSDRNIQIDNDIYRIFMRVHSSGKFGEWKEYCEQSIVSVEGTSTKFSVSQKLLNDVVTKLKTDISANTSNITKHETSITTLKENTEHLYKVVDNIQEIDEELRKDVDTNTSNITELQNEVFPLVVGVSLDKTLVEHTGSSITIKASYNIKRKGIAVTPTSLTYTTDGVTKDIPPSPSGNVALNVTDEGSKTISITATYGTLKATSSASVRVVAPIYCGFGTGVGVAIATNKLSVRTSAVGTYNKTNDAGETNNFIILVPKSIDTLTTFSMGGAPFVMNSSSVVINGVSYTIYISGSTFPSGTSLSVQAS